MTGGMSDRERLLEELRPESFAIAYRMLGSVSEAEDLVQEALLRVHRALEAGVVMMTELRGASNAKAKRELGWRPAHPSWRQGFTAT